MVGGDAHELELMLAEGVGLVRTPSDQRDNHDLVESRDRCHVTLLGADDRHLAPHFVSSRSDHRGTAGNKTRSHRYRDNRKMAAGK